MTTPPKPPREDLAAWETRARAELKGRDPESLTRQTLEDIPVRPL